jgi:uncharacterized protein (DUF1684 family)
MRFVAAALAIPLLLAGSGLLQQERQWRAAYEASLKAPDGWLSVAGLFWLHEGANTAGSDPHADVRLPARAPKNAGLFRLEHGAVTWAPGHGTVIRMQPDTSGKPTIVHVGDLMLTAIRRGDRTGIRLRDPDAPARREFRGTKWFPPNPAWRVKAKWVAYPQPKKIPITNILGMTDNENSPGYAEWRRGGRLLRLEPITEGNQLFFIFRDQTSGKTTYPPGRFLDADAPKNGQVILDFNQAYNPPCAFTPFATCPLPPRQNHLRIAIDAGEKLDGSHVP